MASKRTYIGNIKGPKGDPGSGIDSVMSSSNVKWQGLGMTSVVNKIKTDIQNGVKIEESLEDITG